MLHAPSRPHSRGALALASVLATLAHAIVLVGVLPSLLKPPEVEPRPPRKTPERPLVVRAVFEDPLDKKLKKEQLKEKPLDKKPLDKKPEEKPKEEPKKDPVVIKKIVVQETNTQAPKKPTDYVSDQANRAEVETRARKTTLADALPGKTVPDQIKEATSPDPTPSQDDRHEADKPPEPSKKPKQQQELAMAIKRPRQRPERPQPSDPPPAPKDPERPAPERPAQPDGALPKPDPDRSPVVRQDPSTARPKLSPRDLFDVNPSDYNKVFGERKPSHDTYNPNRRRMKMFGRLESRQRALRASLENMIPEIQAGNHTSVNAHPSVYAGYIQSIHRRIHARWADTYLSLLDTQFPRSHPLQDPSLNVTIEFVINAQSGEFEKVSIVHSSGQLQFDAEAIAVVQGIGKRPNPPPQIISPNGKVYIHWNFFRDGRQCGVFHAHVYIRTGDGHMRQTAKPL